MITTWTISVNKGPNFPFIKSQPKRVFFHKGERIVNLLTKLFYKLDTTFYYFRNFPSCNLQKKILIFSKYLCQYNLQYKSATLSLSIRELKQRRRQSQRERQKSSRSTTLHVHHAFLHISLQSLHDYHDVKMPNTFCGERERKTMTFVFFSWTLIEFFRIEIEKKLLTFDELNEME